MYDSMHIGSQNVTVDRAVALHKMARLATAASAGNGYLNFMGNEFGHPEWIDFPREGNGWSYKYARRQWSLVDNDKLCYEYLGKFDQAMMKLIGGVNKYEKSKVVEINCNDGDQILAYRRDDLLFVFNFSPTNSYSDYGLLVPRGSYQEVLNTDNPVFGGNGLTDPSLTHFTHFEPLHKRYKKEWLKLYIPARSAIVFKKID
jgi:1,4-alpha-glucan branching enzyme